MKEIKWTKKKKITRDREFFDILDNVGHWQYHVLHGYPRGEYSGSTLGRTLIARILLAFVAK
jgi:hypothetical protein